MPASFAGPRVIVGQEFLQRAANDLIPAGDESSSHIPDLRDLPSARAPADFDAHDRSDGAGFATMDQIMQALDRHAMESFEVAGGSATLPGRGHVVDVANAKDEMEKRSRAAREAMTSVPRVGNFLTVLIRFLIRHVLFTRRAKEDLFKALISYTRMQTSITSSLEQIYLNNSDEGKYPFSPIAFVAREWRYNYTEKGMYLGTAAEYWLKKEEVVLINAGAGTPKFEDSLKQCVFIMQNAGVISKHLKKAFIGPAASLAAALSLPVVFNAYLVPALKMMPSFHMNKSEENIVAIGKFVTGDWFVVFGILAAIIVLLLISMPRLTGKIRIYLDKIPPWGFYRVLQGSNFMLTMAALTSSGISMADSMRRIMGNNLSPYMRERMGRTLSIMERGERLGTALYQAGFSFPDKRTIVVLRSAEIDTRFNEILSEVAKESIVSNTEIITKQSRQMAGFIGIGAAYVLINFMFALQSVMLAATNMH